jgi:hypothetical protein
MTDATPALNAALAKVQAELPKLERDRTVTVEPKDPKKPPYSYSYATLANVTDAVLPLLARHGLAFSAFPGAGTDGKMALLYHLLHESGERLSGEFPISGEGGIQMIGGRITYARRYCLAAVVGVAADEDDESRLDSEHTPRTAQRAAAPANRQPAAAKPAGHTTQRAAAPPLPTNGPAGITAPQRAKLMAGFGQVGITDRAERLDIATRIVGRSIGSANELTLDEARRVIDALEKAIGSDNPALTLAEITAQPSGEGSQQ